MMKVINYSIHTIIQMNREKAPDSIPIPAKTALLIMIIQSRTISQQKISIPNKTIS